MEAEHLHPIFVHFVIAPLLISISFDLVWIFKSKESFQLFSWYNLIIAATFGIAAVLTGLIAEENVILHNSSVNEVFENHEFFAFLLLINLLIQIFWRFVNNGKIPVKFSYVYYFITILSLLFVIVTSYFGGKLVFEHGIGIKKADMNEVKNDSTVHKSPNIQFLKPDSSAN